MRKLLRSLLVAGAILWVPVWSAPLCAHAQNSSAQADNSAQNKNHKETNTAQDQSNAKNSREITASIRKALIADKGLSTYAHNVKIITQGQTVILKGPVRSEDEKHQVMSDAKGALPEGAMIVDQLTIKS